MWRRRAWGIVLVVLTGLGLWVRCGPLPDGVFVDEAPSTLVVDRRGAPLHEARSDAGTRGASLSADALPDTLVRATLAAEDHRFRSHWGIEVRSVLRAAWHDLRAGSVVEGGSTITQQVAKLLLARARARRGRTPGADAARPGRLARLARKIDEAVLALRLEHRSSKDEILARYLSLAPYGNQIVGAERASRAYFGHPASMLTTAEAALLASLPQRPSVLNPYGRLDAALRRQRQVLARLESLDWIASADRRRAEAERLDVRSPGSAFGAPHFVEMALARGRPTGGRLETTLDAELQADVDGIVRSHREALESHGAHNVAIVVLANETGEWLAWEGSGDYFDRDHGGTINGPLSPRQPGSALKPFTYALAFESGLTPADVLPDIPANFPTGDGGVWYSPRNYDGRFRGPLRARAALAGSENVPAVALAARLGVPDLLRFLKVVGLSGFEKTAAHYGLGLTLGNAEVRLDELVAAYSAIARGGEWLAPTFSRATVDVSQERRRVMSPRTAFWITDILSDASAREYVFGRGSSLEFPFPVAVKTGTSQAYHDNWTVGYTRDVTVGVWVGNFDRTPLHDSSGVTGAAPIFHAVMLAAERRWASDPTRSGGAGLMAVPPELERHAVCALSGEAATPSCPLRVDEWLPRQPERPSCAWHHLSREEGIVVAWPEEYRAWASERGLTPSQTQAPPPRVVHASFGDATGHVRTGRDLRAGLRILNPPDGATYLIDPTLRAKYQTLPFRAASAGERPLRWTVDDQTVGTARPGAALKWPLAPGRHRVAVEDGDAARAEVTILVK